MYKDTDEVRELDECDRQIEYGLSQVDASLIRSWRTYEFPIIVVAIIGQGTNSIEGATFVLFLSHIYKYPNNGLN